MSQRPLYDVLPRAYEGESTLIGEILSRLMDVVKRRDVSVFAKKAQRACTSCDGKVVIVGVP